MVEVLFDSLWNGICDYVGLMLSVNILSIDGLGLATPVTSLLLSLAVATLSSLVWKWRHEATRDSASSLPLPPGGFGWPLVGETVHFVLKGAKLYEEKCRQHGEIYKGHLLGSPIVRTASNRRISQLVEKESKSLIASLPSCAQYVFGENGLIAANGNDHARMKKCIKQAFTPTRLGDYLPSIQSCIRRHIISWIDESQTNRKLLGFNVCQNLVCDLILETVVGCTREQDPDGRVRDAFVVCNNNLFSVPIAFPGTGFYKVQKARKVVVEFVKHRLQLSEARARQDHVTILDVLVSHQQKQTGDTKTTRTDTSDDGGGVSLSHEELVDNAVTMLVAGADTVSSALCSVLRLLGEHPVVLQTLRDELASEDLLDGGQTDDLSLNVLQSLPYVRAVSREVLRLFPPVGAAFRQTKKMVEMNDCQIPKDWRVIYSIRETHQQTTAFTNKNIFRPDRWLEEGLEEMLRKNHPCSYVPFGFGSRSCVGRELALLEMGVFIVEIARLVDWKILNPAATTVYLPVTKPVDGLPVEFQRRGFSIGGCIKSVV